MLRRLSTMLCVFYVVNANRAFGHCQVEPAQAWEAVANEKVHETHSERIGQKTEMADLDVSSYEKFTSWRRLASIHNFLGYISFAKAWTLTTVTIFI
jgi:hypothetical protein